MTKDRCGLELARDDFLRALTEKAKTDSRFRAVWLEGSLGRGNADRYSDIDLHVLLAEGTQIAWQAWLGELRPLVLFTLMFGGAMVNAMTVDALRIDLWPHAGETVQLDPLRVKVLHALAGVVSPGGAAPAPSPEVMQERALSLIREFWRCISLLPAVLGRQEWLVAFQGLAVELGLVTEILLLQTGAVRDRGVKNLNEYLPAELRQALEQSILPRALTPAALAEAHLFLAELVGQRGPELARQLDFEYPKELENTVLAYVRAELMELRFWAL